MRIFTPLLRRTCWMLFAFVALFQTTQAQTFTIGTQTTQSGTTGISPYNYFWESRHMQFVYRAAELTGAGASAGNITNLAFDISQLATGNPALVNYVVKMKHTTAVNPGTYDGTGLTTVFGPASYQPTVTGFYDLTLSAPFTWNGTDNILVDVCWGVNVSPAYSSSGQVWLYADATGGTPGMRNINSSTANQCGNATTTNTANSNKPRARFTISSAACSGTPAPGNTLASVNPVCNGNTTVLSLQNATSGTGVTYQWYNGGGAISGANSSTYTATITATDNYYCTVTCTNSGQSASSTTLAVNVDNSVAPGTASGPTSAVTYETLDYSLTGYVGSSLQWQSATNIAGPYTDISGATVDTLSSFSNAGGTFYIRCRVIQASCTTYSNAITTVVTVAGNNVCAAVPLSFGNNGPFTNVGATTEVGEPVPPSVSCTVQNGWCSGQTISNSIWFTFVAPASGRVSISAPGWDNQLALYSASSCGDLLNDLETLIAANDDSASSPFNAYIQPLCLTAGQTYYVQLDGYGAGTNSNFIIRLIDRGDDNSFTTSASSVCPQNTAVTLTPTVAGGTFSGTGVTGTNFDASAAGPGMWGITYAPAGACPAANYAPGDTVEVLPYAAVPALVSPVTSPTIICPGSTATLEATALADHTIEWRWFTGAFGGPMTSSTSNPLTTPALTTARTYYAYQQNTLTGCWSQIGTVARINISALPAALAGVDRLVCPGTNTNIGPGSAVSGWTYAWSPATMLSSASVNRPTITGVPVGYNQDYTLTVTNANGCTATDVVNVSARSITNLVAATDAGTDATVCSGQSTTIGSAATMGMTYTWSPFAALDNRYASMPTHLFNSTSSTAATVTRYIVAVKETATGCTRRDTVFVTTNPLPSSIRVNAGADQTIVEGASTVIGGANAVAGLSYAWSPAMGLSSATVAKPTANPMTTTNYTITVSNSFGCSRSDTMTLTVNPVRTGVFGDKVEVVAYPNPVKDALHLSSNLPMNGNLSILMVNELGQTVLSREVSLSDNTLNEELDTRRLAQGVYTVIVRSTEGESSFKIVKE